MLEKDLGLNEIEVFKESNVVIFKENAFTKNCSVTSC